MNELKQELIRRQSTTARLLRALKNNGELTTKELARFGTGCSSRLHELRKEGHRILPVNDGKGQWRYIYFGNKNDDDNTTNISMID